MSCFSVLTRKCKRCSEPFEQPAIRGRPLEFCSFQCRTLTKRERARDMAKDRYVALRAKGYDASVAQPASTRKTMYDALMARSPSTD